MSETTSTGNKRLRWITAVPTTIAAFLGAIVLLADNLEKVLTSKILLILFAIGDFFRLEIVFLIVVVTLRRPIFRAYRAFSSAIVFFVKRARRQPVYILRLAGVGAVLLALTGATGFFLAKYAFGKAIFAKYYASSLQTRARHSYANGNPQRARVFVRVGSEVLRDARFEEMLKELDSRLKRASLLRRALTKLPDASPQRLELIHSIAELDRDRDFETRMVADMKKKVDRLRAVYERGVKEVRAGRLDVARQAFQSVYDDHPLFGDAHEILKEIDTVRSARGAPVNTPYLTAFRSGKAEVVEALVKPAMDLAVDPPPEEVGSE